MQIVAAIPVAVLAGCVTTSPLPPDGLVQEHCAKPEPLSARGSARPVEGAAGLATQRFLGSLADEKASNWGPDEWRAWVGRLRSLALYDGTALAGSPQFDDCAQAHSSADGVQQLQARARVPSDYSFAQKLAGAYPFSAQGMRLGIAAYQKDTQDAWDDFQTLRPLARYAVPLTVPGSPVDATQRLRTAPRDAIGVPILNAALLRELATNFAPVIYVQQQTGDDQPGQPQLASDGVGVGVGVGVDVQEPRLSWRLDYTYAHGTVLPQISWVIWFDQRTPARQRDPYAGALDGLVWRATFGPDGWPVMYDSIHPCGCYHMVFPLRHAAMDRGNGFWEEARLQPLKQVPWAQVSLILDAGTHYLRAVRAQDEAVEFESAASLTLQEWKDSRANIEAAIRPDGVIRGTERRERYWLWPSGVRSPGAMRDWGRHATAFIGEQHFDDFRVLEPYLNPGVLQPVRP